MTSAEPTAQTPALDFLRNEPAVGANAYRVFAAKKGEHAGNEEDFLLTNDGTRARLGPDQLSAAEATTAPKDGSIGGTVFDDFRGDREMDGNDKGLDSVTVYLDIDRDGRPGPNKPATKTNELGGFFSMTSSPASMSFAKSCPTDTFRPQSPRRMEGWCGCWPLPWTNVNGVVIRFDQPVLADTTDLRVRGTRGGMSAVNVVALTGMPNTYLFTLPRPLGGDGTAPFNGDRFVLDLNGDAPNGVRATAAGGSLYLDGNNDGRPGGDFLLPFDVVQGDVNRSGRVNVTDYAATRRRMGSTVDASRRYSVFHDLDGSGAINAQDAQFVRSRHGRTLPAVQLTASAVSTFGISLGLQPMWRRLLEGEEPVTT